MTKSEKMGVAGFVALFVLLAGMIFYSCRHPSRGFEDSVIIKQRIINVEKSR